MKIGDIVKCTSEETGKTKIGIIKKCEPFGAFLVYFGDEEWNEGYWTPSAMEKLCG